jgi:hypothetical protein
MTKLRPLIALVCVLGGLWALAAAPATAAGLSPPLADCEAHGTLTRHYPPAELRAALQSMPADIAEYSNCPDVINRALLADLGRLSGGGASGAGGGSFLPAWAIAVIAVVVLGGAGSAAVAIRNRRRGTGT